ncbi:hypothetical protein T440DRAFT_466648 [Plenodomus tracheiphilus IPT5]|uniref:Uncharacterized protein n=1 Tax=Plenodomus tracheiphilus IPT5 TaxID=1408161 RepID=A0A6A7BAR6_9PLEO|nr:hypothetical protein T440DRAFT_466648 [Plenodomus tracheiphilus IPT5]
MKLETTCGGSFAAVTMAFSMLMLVDERAAAVAQVNACHDRWQRFDRIGLNVCCSFTYRIASGLEQHTNELAVLDVH